MRAATVGGFVVGALALASCFSKPAFQGGQVVPPAAVSSRLAAGRAHACMIDDDQKLWCWGDNSHGQLGDVPANTAASGTALLADPTPGWEFVSAGDNHTCGVRDQQVYCWGSNSNGQSDPSKSTSDVPIGAPLTLPGGEAAKRVFAGGSTTCAIGTSGATYCWGDIEFSGHAAPAVQQLTADPYAIVAIGAEHACAMRDNGDGAGGEAVCWGQNSHHQLGRDGGSLAFANAAPIANPNYNFTSLSAAFESTCGTLREGPLVCWGSATNGVLGPATMESADQTIDSTHEWAAVATSRSHVCALTRDGDVYCYGDNLNGAQGRGSFGGDRSLGAAVLTKASALTTGFDFTCARSTQDPGQGDVWCWGANDVGQIGNKTIAQHDEPVEVPLPTSSTVFVHELYAGDNHACALVGPMGGMPPAVLYAYCWGRNDKHEVDATDGTAPDVYTMPVKVDKPLAHIAAGGEHTCGIEMNQNNLFCWGSNEAGQLGKNNTSHNGTVELSSIAAWDKISAGNRATCGIDFSGNLWCWGAIPGTTQPVLAPMNFQTATGQSWEQISIGAVAMLGVETEVQAPMTRHMLGWGNHCQADQPSSANNSIGNPAPILNGGVYTGIHMSASQTGGAHGCALLERSDEPSLPDPYIECWGSNLLNQVDNMEDMDDCRVDTTIMLPGVKLQSPDPAKPAITTANSHTCVLDENNVAWCWGANDGHVLGGLPSDGTPKQFGSEHWYSLATGASHTCGISEDQHHVLCWGQSRYGQLGDGTRFWPRPTPGGQR